MKQNDRAIRVCVLNGDMSRSGGTERITQLLVNALSKDAACSVSVLNLNNKEGKSFFPLEDSVSFDILPGEGVAPKILALGRYLRKKKIQLLINVDVMLGIFAFPARLMAPHTKIISWEMFTIRNDIGSSHTHMVRQYALRKSAYYVTLTKSDMEAFQREMKVRCPITYIHNPVMKPLSEGKYDLSSKQLMTAGHFFRAKGYDLAVEVGKIIFQRFPDWTWAFYGDGKEMAAIQDKVKAYGLEKQFKFCGKINDMEAAYPKASMYIMTSRTEGFGLVLTEAKTHHLPTVAFDVDFGPREIIEDGISGYLIQPFDTERMAEKVMELMSNAEKRKAFSDHAADNLDLFSMDTFTGRWKEIILEVMTKKHKG